MGGGGADQESGRTESKGQAEVDAARRVCVRGRNRPLSEVGHTAGRAERAPWDTLSQPRWTAVRARAAEAAGTRVWSPEAGPGWRCRREASSWGGRAGGCPTLPRRAVEKDGQILTESTHSEQELIKLCRSPDHGNAVKRESKAGSLEIIFDSFFY